jgi:hypothetical protein
LPGWPGRRRTVASDGLVPLPDRGLTPREAGRLLRISPDRVRAMIRRGELGAIDTAPHRCGRARFIILPSHLAEWERSRRAGPPPPTPRRRRRAAAPVDYYP